MSKVARLVSDPLLGVAKVLLWFLIGSLGLGAVATLFAAPLLFLGGPWIAPHIQGDMPAAALPAFLNALSGVCLLVTVLLAMVCVTLYRLKQIVDTVGEGDPFVPQNARRLTQMAWLTLGVQVATLPIVALGIVIARLVKEVSSTSDISVDSGFSGNGLLLMLILFILARVFRKGAEMRAELEGMV